LRKPKIATLQVLLPRPDQSSIQINLLSGKCMNATVVTVRREKALDFSGYPARELGSLHPVAIEAAAAAALPSSFDLLRRALFYSALTGCLRHFPDRYNFRGIAAHC